MSSVTWVLLPLFLVLACCVSQVCACFAVIVGRDASADGSVLIGHNEENYGRRTVNFRRIPRRSFDADAIVTLHRGGRLEQIPETAAFLWSEVPETEFSDGYLNEWGVAVVSDACSTREDDYEAMVARGEIRDGGIGYMLRRLVAERAHSAVEGVELAGALVERFGYVHSGRTYVIADSNEAWLFAAVRGRRWVAQRVPDDGVVILPNVHVIGQIDLDDPAQFRASADLIDYAVGRGWYDSASGEPFNFHRAYQTADRLAPDPRRWRGQQLVTGGRLDEAPQAPLPLAVRPKQKMTVAMVASILRHRSLDLSLYKPGTQESAVFQLRRELPREIGCVYWRTTGRPSTSVFTPWYLGVTETPADYFLPIEMERHVSVEHHFQATEETAEYETSPAWRRFHAIEEAVDRQGGEDATRLAAIRATWDRMEQSLFERQADVERRAIGLWAADKNAARTLLTDYCAAVAQEASDRALRLSDRMRK